MRFVRTAALLVGSLGAAITKASAGAATFDWTLSVPSNVTSGGFTYTGSLTATMTGTPGVYIINSMTGEVNGNSVSLLAPGSFEGNSNQLLLNQPFLLGSNGFSLLAPASVTSTCSPSEAMAPAMIGVNSAPPVPSRESASSR